MIGGNRIATAAMIATAFAGAGLPAAASARPYGGGGYRGGWGHYGYGHYRGHGDGVFGAIVGGLVVGGLIAVIGGAGRGRGDGGDGGGDNPRGDEAASRPGEDAAVDQCAVRVEGETAGTVDTIDAVDRFADGWRVAGTVDAGGRGEGAFRGRDSFSCSIVNGRIDDIRFGEEGRDRPPAPAPAR